MIILGNLLSAFTSHARCRFCCICLGLSVGRQLRQFQQLSPQARGQAGVGRREVGAALGSQTVVEGSGKPVKGFKQGVACPGLRSGVCCGVENGAGAVQGLLAALRYAAVGPTRAGIPGVIWESCGSEGEGGGMVTFTLWVGQLDRGTKRGGWGLGTRRAHET